jgi:phycoerythrin-associated linker protein
MNIAKFVHLSLGNWRSQRSAHYLAFANYEQATSCLEIAAMAEDAPEVIEICKSYDVDPEKIISPFRMTWQGESDWNEEDASKGTTIFVPVPDRIHPNKGKLLNDRAHVETVAVIGSYEITKNSTFISTTKYDRAVVEERIWFATGNLRFRVSTVETSDSVGVTTASFSSEIRVLGQTKSAIS